MARRPVAMVTAVVLVAEAAVLGWLHWFLGLAVERQQMSLAGLEPGAMSLSAWIAGGLMALYLVVCGLVLLRAARRDRPPRGLSRILLIVCAVVHALLGALCVGLVGWGAFTAMMLVLALLVLSLVVYEPQDDGRRAGAPQDAPPSGPASGGAGPGLKPTAP